MRKIRIAGLALVAAICVTTGAVAHQGPPPKPVTVHSDGKTIVISKKGVKVDGVFVDRFKDRVARISDFYNSASVAIATKDSNYFGLCGNGATSWCHYKTTPWCYAGGDGKCRVGYHSLQMEGYFQEYRNGGIDLMACQPVIRVEHLHYGETYWEDCHEI